MNLAPVSYQADAARTHLLETPNQVFAYRVIGRDDAPPLVLAMRFRGVISGDPTQASRTWVLLTEAAEGGWGLSGIAFGHEEFAALAARAKASN